MFLRKNSVMKLTRVFYLCAALLLGACSSGDDPESPAGSQPLTTPAPTLTVQNQKATVRWKEVANVRLYGWELQQDDQSPQSGTCYTTSYSFDMAEGSTYRFRVKALAREGSAYTDSAWSEYVEASSNMLPAPVPEEVPGSLTDSAVAIGWEAVSGAESYGWELYAWGESAPVQSASTQETTIRIEGLSAGVSYRFRVMAYAESATVKDSSWSGDLNFVTRSVEMLAAPVVTVATVTTSSAVITWEPVAGASRYYFCGAKASDPQSALWETELSETRHVLEGLQEQTAYVVRVKALADENDPYVADSELSEAVQFTTRSSSGVDVGLPLSNEVDGVLRAFPGAEGGGMYTTGGRGGKVYHVTNLSDDGKEGSLRWAVNQSGARTIVFDVCGTIQLKSTLNIKYGDLTIAGQTAPGEGICLRDYSVQLNADNVIIRYMRFRMGDETKQENDAIWGRYHRNIILDHCSMSWSTDECASFYANQNFTMQWCLLGESLKNSVHGKGSHGYGGIWGGKNASFHHNMLACHDSRNARIDHPQVYGDYVTTHRGHVDYRNNLIYNWGSEVTYGGEGGWFNIVANYYKRGPASPNRAYFVNAYGEYIKDNVTYTDSYGQFYIDGNVNPDQEAITADNKKGINWKNGSNHGHYNEYLAAPLAILANDATLCYTSTHTAEEACEQVLSWVGASLRRDGVDSRLVGDARTASATYTDGGNGSKNGIIDTQTAVGGWPTLSATEEEIARAATDSDKDGIPDYYEQLLGIDASNAADAAQITLDPQGLYSNLEVYLHYLVKEITAGQVAGASYTALQ